MLYYGCDEVQMALRPSRVLVPTVLLRQVASERQVPATRAWKYDTSESY